MAFASRPRGYGIGSTVVIGQVRGQRRRSRGIITNPVTIRTPLLFGCCSGSLLKTTECRFQKRSACIAITLSGGIRYGVRMSILSIKVNIGAWVPKSWRACSRKTEAPTVSKRTSGLQAYLRRYGANIRLSASPVASSDQGECNARREISLDSVKTCV